MSRKALAARSEQAQAHPRGVELSRGERKFAWTPGFWRSWTEKESPLIQAHFEAQTEAVFALLQRDRPRLILEAGCGYGRMTGLVALRFQDASIIAIDRSRTMTNAARAGTSAANVTFCLATVEDMPFRNAQFDAVVCVGVIMHVDRDEKALSELLRMVRPGGTLIITFNNFLNPFALAFAAYARLKKPEGYVQRFHRLAFYCKRLGVAAVLKDACRISSCLSSIGRQQPVEWRQSSIEGHSAPGTSP